MADERQLLMPGKVLHGTYEIVRLIGAGGMGQVYEARHTRLPGRFAVKVIAPRVAIDRTDVWRFRREAEIASTLGHPHIVHVVDFNEQEGTPYLVMEFVGGSDLAAELRRARSFSPRRTLSIVEQIADGLYAAHAVGIVHRDLKPQNVLLIRIRATHQDFVKIVDFGISKVAAAGSLTDGAGIVGTPEYMAPEQAEGRHGEVDPRTDQFALAAMAYEMLSGKRPFWAENRPATLRRILHEQPAPLVTLLPDLPHAADEVIRKALAKKKGARYRSVLNFADALADALGFGRRIRDVRPVSTSPSTFNSDGGQPPETPDDPGASHRSTDRRAARTNPVAWTVVARWSRLTEKGRPPLLSSNFVGTLPLWRQNADASTSGEAASNAAPPRFHPTTSGESSAASGGTAIVREAIGTLALVMPGQATPPEAGQALDRALQWLDALAGGRDESVHAEALEGALAQLRLCEQLIIGSTTAADHEQLERIAKAISVLSSARDSLWRQPCEDDRPAS